jgi:hypothetical protein
MRKPNSFIVAVLVAVCHAATASADPIPLAAAAAPATGTFVSVWGPPTRTPPKNQPLTLKVTIAVNGQPVTREVPVPGVEAWKDSLRGNRTIDQWYTDRVKAMGDASQAKTRLIADAINKAFEAEFKMLGETATVDTVKSKPMKVYHNKTADLGMLMLPGALPPDPKNVDPKTKEPVYTRENSPIWLVTDPANESGNGGSFIPKSMGSLGFQGIMAPIDLALVSYATGYDPYGEASVVSFGIQDRYVAEVTPTSGMSLDEVLLQLEALLDGNGLPATFDAILKELTLDGLVRDGDMLVWGNTDPGFGLLVAFGSPDLSQIPEPAAVALFGTGLMVWAARRRRRAGRLDGAAVLAEARRTRRSPSPGCTRRRR